MMDPTARGDTECSLMRRWYEANRESWWARHRPQIFSYRDNSGVVADNFMIRLLREADRIGNLSDKALSKEYGGGDG
jgi:hypothetical protein